MSGSRLGPYEILSPLGAGGMGEVYRARDTKLGRDVALKILPESFTHDPERVARFQREAQVLASLNHPHIGGIYGLEEANGVRALVLELVEGPTLADRIAQSPIPLDEALPIARQIAEALEAAHEQGIIHRDLKPANIKVRPDGAVKVLDFGLAKALDPVTGIRDGSPYAKQGDPSPFWSQSPTMTSPAMTGMGVILGTAAYMSPEQAKGKGVDKRADIWAFGCVLYEMLTGTRAFAGEDVSDTLAFIITKEPDWTALPPNTPGPIRRLLHRCMEKDRKERIPDISVARFEIKEALTTPSLETVTATAVRPSSRWRRAAAVALAVLAGSALTGTAVWLLARPVPPRVTRFDIVPLQTAPFAATPAGANVAISSNGAQVVYHVRRGSAIELELRRLDRLDSQPIPGTEGATQPVFSPDGSSLAFIKDRKLQKLRLDAKGSVTVCEAISTVEGASWVRDDTIVFAQTGPEGGLFRVPAAGGKPARVAAPDAKSGEQYAWPDVLPDGKAVLFTIRPVGASIDRARVAVRSLETGEQKVLIDGGSYPQYVPTGHLLYVQAGTLMGIRFDSSRLEIIGSPVPVQAGVVTKGTGVANYAVARDGSLVYAAGSAVPYVSRFVWKGRDGKLIGTAAGDQLEYPRYPRISPNGRRLAATVGPSNEGNIWIYDLTGASQPLKLTFKAHNVQATWTPDGSRVVFGSNRDGQRNLFWVPADASVLEPERLATSDNSQGPWAWSPDGQWLLFAETSPQSGSDIWLLPTTGEKKPRPWLQTSFDEAEPSFSTDGRWVAYVSDQTGRPEVWVRPFPGPGSPTRVSPEGGHDPVWSRDGDELFYQEGTKLVTAVIAAKQPELQFKPPRLLFEGGFTPYEVNSPRTYDVASDGRFLMIEPTPSASAPLTIVLNWAEELRRLVPKK